MARKKQDPAIRKNEFIEAATRLFQTKGFESTSLRDVLKALGGETALSPSVFYYYFKSKDELLDACLSAYVDRYADDLNAVLADKTLDFQAVMQKAVSRVNEALNDVHVILTGDNTDNTFFHNLIAENLFGKIIPQLSLFVGEGLENGTLPMTDLAKECGPYNIARLICGGITTLFHSGTGCIGEHHHFENARLIPVYVAHILGLPFSMFKQD